MAYQGLILEFGEYFLESMGVIIDAPESKRQILADSINAVFLWHLQEPDLEDMQNDFLFVLYYMSTKKSEFIPDITVLMGPFIEFYENESQKIKDSLKDMSGNFSRYDVFYQEFTKHLQDKAKHGN